MWKDVKNSFERAPLTKKQKSGWYQRPPSLAEKLPWMEYDAASGAFLLDDGRSLAAVLECQDVASEARPERYLAQLQRALQGVFQDVFPMYFDNESPWVVQFYLQDELTLAPFFDKYQQYINTAANQSELTHEYLRLMNQHLQYLTQPQGIFVDQKVSGLPFRGKRRKVRVVLYRRLHAKSRLRPGMVDSTRTQCCGIRFDGEVNQRWRARTAHGSYRFLCVDGALV